MSMVAATLLYMAVSSISLIVQLTTLLRILAQSVTVRAARAGLVRTACCRVASSAAYVCLGVAALENVPDTGMAALITLLATQVMWQLNGLADVRVARRLGTR